MGISSEEQKREVLEQLLDEGMVLVTLDARRDDVSVPQHLKCDPQLRLNLSYRFGLPLDIDDEGVHTTLTFSGQPFECRLPWSSIYLFVSHNNGKPYLFPNAIPKSIAGLDENSPLQPQEKSGAQQPTLQVVHSTSDSPELKANEPSEKPPSPPKNSKGRPNYLRVVK